MNNTTLRHLRSVTTLHRVCAAALLAIGLSASPAWAQLSRIGANPNLGASPIRGTDTAFDPVNNVFLVVGSHAAMTPLFGVFTDAAGNAVTAPFQINNGGEHAHFPRVAYSPNVSNGAGGFGGFLVTWHGGLWTTSIRARVVAFPNRVVSSEVALPNLTTTTSQEKGAAVAYGNNVFLVTWEAAYTIWGARVGLNGQVIGGTFQISQSDPGGGARDPGVAYNPNTNEFGVVYTGWGSGGATTTFARVSAGGTVLRRNTFNFAGGTYITDLAFNSATGRFIAAWGQGSTYGAEIDANGDVVTKGLLSTVTGTYDGLGLSYNPTTGTFLLAGQGPSYNAWGAELNSRGARTSADTEITSVGKASFYPRASASSNDARWNVSFHSGGTLYDQVVYSSSRNGGPAGSLGSVGGGTPTPPPPPPPPGPGGCTTPDPFAAIGGGTCVNGGWVPGGGSGGGSNPGGCTSASPGTGWTCVNGGWVPPTSGGGSGGSGGCTTGSPGSGWTCVNGGWLPPGSGGGGGSNPGGCTTLAPGPGWTCSNGGWVPPTSGGGSGGSGGCTTADPFTAMGGGTCVNGGWVPGRSGGGTGGCATASPGSGWTCVNGGWLPPGSGGGSNGGSSSTCSTPDPFAAMGGGTCVNGGWTFGSSGSSGGCTTSDPFTAMGGGVCVNGGWTPRR